MSSKKSGGRARVLEFATPESVENTRRDGAAALHLRCEIQTFVESLEAARQVYQDPARRRFLDMPDDQFEAEIEGLKSTADLLGQRVAESFRQWTRYTSRKGRGRIA